MPEIVACPDCGRKLRVPDDLLGRKVKCPGCGVNFVASVAGPASAAVSSAPARPKRDDYEPAPRQDDYEPDVSSKRSVKDGWKRVRSGLGFVLTSIWVFIGVFVLKILIGWVLVASLTASTGVWLSFMVFSAFGDMAVVGLDITGLAFCMGAPPNKRYPVRGLGMTAFILSASFGAVSLLHHVIYLVSLSDAITTYSVNPFAAIGSLQSLNMAAVLELLGYVIHLAAFITFLFFLRAACQAVKKDKLGTTIVTYMLVVGGVVFLAVVVSVLIVALAGAVAFSSTSIRGAQGAASLGILLIGFWCLLGLAFLGLFIWYIVLLFQVKGVVDYYIRRL
jgi:hypothetical protein